MGRITSKGVGGKITQSRLQNIDLSYTVRGWLKQINDVDNMANDLFSFKLNYNMQEGAIQFSNLYNGNISQSIWRTANSDNDKRGYSYEYDDLNRLKRGLMRKGDNLDVYTRHHLRSVSYDKNGNILNLQRDNAVSIMDNLTYVYSGNKLLTVTDLYGTNHPTEGFVDNNTQGNDYSYDVNGNMEKDLNKGISNIVYNHLNLPTQLTTASGSINYVYDAIGTKLEKIVSYNGGSATTTRYAGNFFYKEDNTGESLQFFSHPEGYVETQGNGFRYVYQYKDHLGNIRLSYTDYDADGIIDILRNNTDIDGDGDYQHEIVEENNYYPFGLQHKGYNDAAINGNEHPYKYNSSELEKAFGINLYEMDMRQYDPAIARWTAVDPVTHHTMSTYTAFDNNPVIWADPSGADAVQQDDFSGRDQTQFTSSSLSDDWIPNVDLNGTITYTAEKGDNVATLKSQYGLKDGVAEEIIGDRDIKAGDTISGEEVANVTGNEVLKLDLGNKKTTGKDIAYQMLFSIRNESIIDEGWIESGSSEYADYTVNGHDYFSSLDKASASGADGMFDGFGTGNVSINLNETNVSLTISYGKSGDGRYSNFSAGRQHYYKGKTRLDFLHPDAYDKNQRYPLPIVNIRASHKDSEVIQNYIRHEN